MTTIYDISMLRGWGGLSAPEVGSPTLVFIFLILSGLKTIPDLHALPRSASFRS